MDQRLRTILSLDTYKIYCSVKNVKTVESHQQNKAAVVEGTVKIYKPIDRSWTINDLFLNRVPIGWEKIFNQLKDLVSHISDVVETSERDHKSIVPDKDELFTAFDMCPVNNLRVVIVGQDPYDTIAENSRPNATGMAFSCREDVKICPSAAVIISELSMSYKEAYNIPSNGDFSSWAKQGVLLLNCALTVGRNDPGSHLEIWKEFTISLLQLVSKTQKKLVYFFVGSKAREFSENIRNSIGKFFCCHPAAKFRNPNIKNQIEGSNVFVKINRCLKKNGIGQIEWNTQPTESHHKTIE